MKRMTALFVLLACMISLVSCSGGVKRDEAKACIEEFLAAVSDEDYGKAEKLLHPDYPIDVKKYFEHEERDEGVDLQGDIQIQRYTGFSSAWYDSDVQGSKYELTLLATVGERRVEFEIEVVKNDGGFGIYELDLDTTP